MIGNLPKGAYQGKDIQPLSRAYYNAYFSDAWRKKHLVTRTERDSRISHTAEEGWEYTQRRKTFRHKYKYDVIRSQSRI